MSLWHLTQAGVILERFVEDAYARLRSASGGAVCDTCRGGLLDAPATSSETALTSSPNGLDRNRQGGGLAHEVVGSGRVVAFGLSNVAPAGAVVAGLVLVVFYAGFASPLVIIIAFAASLCCANSISEFARKLPSAGSLYTYNSRGLGRMGGFLTGWVMIFAYALYVPAGISLTSSYASSLLADTLHVSVDSWALFVIILAVVSFVAYLGIATSSVVDLALVTGEMAVFAALAITILVKVGPAHYSLGVLSPASSPHQQISDITSGMIYGITAFAGFEAASTLSEEARRPRRTVPVSVLGVVVVAGIFYLLVVFAEMSGVGREGVSALVRQANPLAYLAGRYWSTSVLWLIDLVVVLTGLGFVTATFNAVIRVLFAMGRERALPGSLARLSHRHTPMMPIALVGGFTLLLGLPLTYNYGGGLTFRYLAAPAALSIVLMYLAVNVATIWAFRTEFRDEFQFWKHLVLPAIAALLLLFPLWGAVDPRSGSLVDLLPFVTFGWLLLGVIAAALLRARRPTSFDTLGRVFMPNVD